MDLLLDGVAASGRVGGDSAFLGIVVGRGWEGKGETEDNGDQRAEAVRRIHGGLGEFCDGQFSRLQGGKFDSMLTSAIADFNHDPCDHSSTGESPLPFGLERAQAAAYKSKPLEALNGRARGV